jgi:hypothetical protein
MEGAGVLRQYIKTEGRPIESALLVLLDQKYYFAAAFRRGDLFAAALRRGALRAVRFAPARFAPARLVRFAPARLVRFAPARFTVRFAAARFAGRRLAAARFTVRFVARFAAARFAGARRVFRAPVFFAAVLRLLDFVVLAAMWRTLRRVNVPGEEVHPNIL